MTIFGVSIFYVPLVILCLAVVACFTRMVIGPALSDRVIALDLTASLLISIIAVYSLISKQAVYIDVVIALALIVFLGTVAFAQYVEWQRYKKIKKEKRDD
ncbi:monovalent cation/H+ antiporter complex subunit F [Coxiella burnetii]|uniref:monovalent cation/H+ antiporter complex subunit F n=1 Tax=Coxiella burnetii TaxID=777 RepID=UPI0000ED02D4|nr:monovalent cation/H+ antiporter complex subunit F [Coxiella burnetii]ACJ20939.1 sodium/proton antiporter protein [Coxiella burnetii CbuK_Q154]AIT64016.1 Na(+)/H(+) antiporter subunit F [Coxiella burnetii str. Namibia]ATN86507.1 cation:proton antiporter [Coxiella burnetii str. Schperling]EAX32391.1 cation:proton antiporter [Coxiella burnetii 'MSU Goat Q177']EDR36133.1 Na(+)/H(+) antiporter subunit F [Coxiella burnetii Q321]